MSAAASLGAPWRTVRTPSGDCAIHVGRGLLAKLGTLEAIAGATGVATVADHTTDGLFRETLEGAVRDPARPFARAAFEPGEGRKTLSTAEGILELLVTAGLDRDAVLVACGGGVVTDLAGFVASVFLRGVPWVAAPTTLLAMVDASVGGKTGVDLRAGKNLAGTIHPPRAVVVDLDTLATLPRRERASGLAEVVKIALATDGDLLERISREAASLLGDEGVATEEIVRRAIERKVELVERDETDRGARRALNLGHTTGHALEAATGYGRFLHGEAVAIGLRVACEAATARGTLDSEVTRRVVRLLEALGLPSVWPSDLDAEEVLARARFDKKAARGRLRLVLPTAAGATELVEADLAELVAAARRAR